MARATFINLETLRKNRLHEEYPAVNWDDRFMNQKLLSISQSLEGAEMYISAAKEYIESSRGVMERLTDFITLAQVDVKTAEECIVQTEGRIRCLKSEINFNLAQNLDYLQQTSKDSAKNVENSSSEKTNKDTSEQVLNIIKKYVEKSENIEKYKVRHDKYNGVTVIVIGSPKTQGNSSMDQDKDSVHGLKDSLDILDRTLDCDLDSLDYSTNSCASIELGFYEIDHTGECCINIDGNCEPSFHVDGQIASEECNARLPENVNKELHSSNESFDNNCNFHTAENYSDYSSNRESDKCRIKYRTDKRPSGNEDFLIPELLSNNVEVSICSQKKYLSDCDEYLLNEPSCSEISLVEISESENSLNECLEPTDFVYFSDSPSRNLDLCRSSITRLNQRSTNENKSLLKEMPMENEGSTNFTGAVNRDAISSNVVNDASCQENVLACRILEDSTDTSLNDNSYITLSEASCDTSQNEFTSDTSLNNEDSSDTSVENLSNESLLNCSGSSYTEISSIENLSESKSSSNMSLTDCLDSSADEIVSFSSNTNSSMGDSTRSLLSDVWNTSVNCDSSILSQNDELSYACFKDGVSSAYKKRKCQKESSKSRTNRLSSAKLAVVIKEAENDKITSFSPESESSKSQDCELLLTKNSESESLGENSSVIESPETGKTY